MPSPGSGPAAESPAYPPPMHRLGVVAHKSSTCLCTDSREAVLRRLAGSSGSERAPVPAYLASAPRAGSRDTLAHQPPLPVRTDVRRCRAHVVRRREPGQESACALVGTDMIKMLANRNHYPLQMAAEFYAFIGCYGHSCVSWGRTSISVRRRANKQS